MKKSTFVVGPHCFLSHPCGEKGYWARTDRCVAFVDCSYPGCLAKAGEMCQGRSGARTANTHALRRDEYQQRKGEFDPARKQATYIIIEELPVAPLTDAADEPDSPRAREA